MSRLRICLYTDSLEPAGLGQHMLNLVAELQHDHALLLVAPFTAGGAVLLQRAAGQGCRTFALPIARTAAGPQVDLTRLRSVVSHFAPDVFHVHAHDGMSGQRALDIARRCGVPAQVRTEHQPYMLTRAEEKEHYAQNLETVDRVICVSATVQGTFLAAGVPAGKLSVVRNGIRSGTPGPHPSRTFVRRELGLPLEAPVVLTVARLAPPKGYRHLLAAVPSVLAQVPDTHFVWAGSGSLGATLRELIDEEGLSRHVRLLGQRDDVSALMGSADLFVLPSLFDGLPHALLEALAAGLPVIGTQVCGITDAVADGYNGRLVPRAHPAALASAIIEALSRPDLTAAWGANGRRRFAEQFSAARMATETTAIYNSILNVQTARVPERVAGPVRTQGQVSARPFHL